MMAWWSWGGAPPPWGREAFRWTAETGMIRLGDLPGGAIDAAALDVSADGSIVVGWGCTTGNCMALPPEAFIWDATNGMRNSLTCWSSWAST